MPDSLKDLFPFDPKSEGTLRRRLKLSKIQAEKMVNGDETKMLKDPSKSKVVYRGCSANHKSQQL
jgi:hypothetical protein